MENEENKTPSYILESIESLLPPAPDKQRVGIASSFVETLQKSCVSKNKSNHNLQKPVNKMGGISGVATAKSFSPKVMAGTARSENYHKSKEIKIVNSASDNVDKQKRVTKNIRSANNIPMLTLKKILFFDHANKLDEGTEKMIFPYCAGCANYGYSNKILDDLANKICNNMTTALPIGDNKINELNSSGLAMIFPYLLPCVHHRDGTNIMTEIMTKNVFKIEHKQLSVTELKSFTNDKSCSTVFFQCVSADLQMSKGIAKTTIDALGGRGEIDKILAERGELRVGDVVKCAPARSQLTYVFFVTKERVTDPVNWEKLVGCFQQIPLLVAAGRYTKLVTVDMACGLDLKRIRKNNISAVKVVRLLSEIINVLTCRKIMYISSAKTIQECIDSGVLWNRDGSIFLHHRVDVLNGSPLRVSNITEITLSLKLDSKVIVNEPLKVDEIEEARSLTSDDLDDEDDVNHINVTKLDAVIEGVQPSLYDLDEQSHAHAVDTELGITQDTECMSIVVEEHCESVLSVNTNEILEMSSLHGNVDEESASTSLFSEPQHGTSPCVNNNEIENDTKKDGYNLIPVLKKPELLTEIPSNISSDEQIVIAMCSEENKIVRVDLVDSGHATPEKTSNSCMCSSTRLSALENDFRESQSLIKGLQDINQTLLIDVGRLNLRIKLMENQILEKNKSVSILEQDNIELRDVNEELKKLNENQGNELNSCYVQIEKLRNEYDSYKELLINEQEKTKNSYYKIEEMKQEYESIVGKNDMLQYDNDCLIAENTRLRAEINELNRLKDQHVPIGVQKHSEISNYSCDDSYMNKSTQSFLLANTVQLKMVREAVERIDKISSEICDGFNFHIHCRSLITNASLTALNNIGRMDVIIPRNQLLKSQLLEYGVMPKDFTRIKQVFNKSELVGLSCDADVVQVQAYMDGYV